MDITQHNPVTPDKRPTVRTLREAVFGPIKDHALKPKTEHGDLSRCLMLHPAANPGKTRVSGSP